jgi:REP element-mobilizing transposase RayT
MLFKVLACSTESSTLETLNDWAAHQPMVELHTISSPEILGELISSDAYNALILDTSDPEVTFSDLMPRLALLPGMKVLLIGSQADGQNGGSLFSNAVGQIQLPVTTDTLTTKLNGLIGNTQQPESTASLQDSSTDGVSDADEDLAYLKDWIAEDLPETQLSPDPDLVEIPQSAKKSTSNTKPSQPGEPLVALNEFSCVILPRDPQCFLTQAIAERLALILPWIHANNGWRLTGISIRPRHLQWSVALPAATSPTSAIHEIMQRTSDQLIDSFPDLQDDAADQGFWAREYLAISGTQSAPYSMIKAFVDRTRLLQTRGE